MRRQLQRARSPFIIMSAAHDAARAAWHARFDARVKPTASAKPKALEVKASGDVTEILLYEEIGFWGVTAVRFKEAFDAVQTPKILLRVNSPGGDVFDGYAIYNIVKASLRPVDVVIDGVAASAASFVSLAGKTVTMGSPSMMMIHRAWAFAFGNAKAMTDTAAVLEKIDGQIAAIYAAKAGRPMAEMLNLMTAETWLTAQEAKDLGLVDQIGDPDGDKEEEPEEDGDEEKRSRASAHAARMRAARLIELGVW
jgi:ATP-dependent protease ClpP protease subunit